MLHLLLRYHRHLFTNWKIKPHPLLLYLVLFEPRFCPFFYYLFSFFYVIWIFFKNIYIIRLSTRQRYLGLCTLRFLSFFWLIVYQYLVLYISDSFTFRFLWALGILSKNYATAFLVYTLPWLRLGLIIYVKLEGSLISDFNLSFTFESLRLLFFFNKF